MQGEREALREEGELGWLQWSRSFFGVGAFVCGYKRNFPSMARRSAGRASFCCWCCCSVRAADVRGRLGSELRLAMQCVCDKHLVCLFPTSLHTQPHQPGLRMRLPDMVKKLMIATAF